MEDREKEICSFLDKKLSLFQQYLSVTKKLKEAFIEEGKGNPGVFIAERQGLIDRIEKNDSSMDKFIRSGASQAGTGSLPETIGARLEEIKALMERLKPMDAELIAMVREAEEQARKSLLKMRKSRQAVNGYQRIGKTRPRFFDELR